MALWRSLARGLRVLTNRAAADGDVAAELDHYVEEATAAFVARGLPPDEARRAARLEAGSFPAVRDQVRGAGWEHLVWTVVSDLRYGARRLRREPAFAAVAIVTLGLGIGATTAIFSAVNPILFQPLPYPSPSRIATVWDQGAGRSRLEVTFGTCREIADRSRSFEALACVKPWQPTLTGAAEPERLDGQRVGAGYFRVLGVSPALGRDFDAADDRVRGPNVVMLADGLWRRRFGADAGIVGRDVLLNDTPYTVVGVMPRGFEDVLAPSAEAWALLQYDAAVPLSGREWGHHLRMIARVRAGVRIDHAGRELDAIAAAPLPEFPRAPWASLGQGFLISTLQDDVTRGVKPALVALMGAVALLLAIAGVNVANLVLARGARRRGELAMRAALGAGRWRLVQQLITETMLLAGAGGALGLVAAGAGVRALVALSPAGLPRAHAIGVDATAFVFAAAVTIAVGAIVGIAPAWLAARSDLQATLQHSSRTSAGGHHRARRALVVAEVALAVVLLASAGLLFRSLDRLFAVRPGFDPAQLLTMQVQAAGHRYDDARAIERFFERALDAVREVPGVGAAAFTSQLPLSGDFDKYGVVFESKVNERPGEDQSAHRYAVSPGYIEAMGIPLKGGRLVDARDTTGVPTAVLVNESFARRKFGDGDPVGQRIHIGRTDLPWYTIVGVVGDVRQTSLALGVADGVYVPAAQWYSPDRVRSLVVRARVDAASLAPAIRRAIWSVDRDQPIVRVATMEDLVARSAGERRFALTLFAAFALVAVALAATGIYGVLAGSVTERTREIGVRAALGATRANIVTLVVREGLVLTGVGIGFGAAGAMAASGALVTLLFGVSRLDPATYAAVVALLGGVAGVACAVPALRAARVDPSIALRLE